MYRTWPEKSVRMSLSRSIHEMIWQYSGWFGPQQTNLSLRLLPSSSLPNCEELSIDWCFRLCFGLSCFTHFVLLQLLIKHKARVNEMSSKHLPHYGFCYVRNYEWEPVFLIQKRKTARIKDVNKSQGKLIANLSSLVWLYFYYKVLSRSFLEMFKKNNILLLVRIQLKLTQSWQMYSYWSFCTWGAMLGFFLSSWTTFFFLCCAAYRHGVW